MTTQTEAQLLADALDDEFAQGRISNHTGRKAAAELNRLEEVSTHFQDAYGQELKTSNELRKANAELLKALKLCAAVCAGETMSKNGLIAALEKARDAIAKHGGQS